MSARQDILDQRIKRIVSEEQTMTEASPTCPDESRIVLYYEGGLSDVEREVMESHFAGCPRCLDALVAYSALTDDSDYNDKEATRQIRKRAKSLVPSSSSGLTGRLASFLPPLWNRWTPVWAAPLILILLLPIFWFGAKPAIERVVVERTQKALGEHGVAIEGLDIGWRSVLVKGLTLAEGDKKVLSIGDATFEFELKDLLDGEVVISRLTVDSAQFSLSNSESGGFTFKGLEKLDLSVLGDTPLRFESSTIVMTNGSLSFVDNSTGAEPVIIKLAGISFTANNFNYPSTGAPEFQIQGQIEQAIDPGSFYVTGWTDTATGELNLDARFENVDLTMVTPYFSNRVSSRVTGGLFDAELTLSKREKRVETSGAFWLKDLTVTDPMGDFLGVPIPRLMDMMAVSAQGVKIPFGIAIEPGKNVGLLLEDILDALQTSLRSVVNS